VKRENDGGDRFCQSRGRATDCVDMILYVDLQNLSPLSPDHNRKGKRKMGQRTEKSENRKGKSENDSFCQSRVRVTDSVRHGSMYHVTTRERVREKRKT
jgi:hypothetical protein